MTQENRFTSFTTCGMPIKFQLRDKDKIVGYEKWCPSVTGAVDGRLFLKPNGSNWTWDYIPHTDKDQAIGATSSDDPPQELYLGDLIEVSLFRGGKRIGEIKWNCHTLQVEIKFANTTMMFHVFLPKNIKKLGSRHTEEGKRIAEKAGLE